MFIMLNCDGPQLWCLIQTILKKEKVWQQKREDFKKDRMKKVKGNIENQFLSEFGPNINGCVLMFSCGCFLCHHVTCEVAAWGLQRYT